jgi:hypothetical protein
VERELDSTEIQILSKSAQILIGLQELAELANKHNIPNLIQDMEVLSLMLPEDSQFIESTKYIKKLYDEAVINMESIYTNLQSIPQSQESD